MVINHSHFVKMKMMSKSQLKARMLEEFRKIEETGEPIAVTSHGKPTLEVRPIRNQKQLTIEEVLAIYRSGREKDSIMDDPALLPTPAEDWEVLSENDANPW